MNKVGGDDSSRIQKGGELIVRTGNRVNASWSIENTVGIEPNSCRINSVNIEGGDSTVIYNKTVLGFTVNNEQGNALPVNEGDQKYRISLTCTGKPAKTQSNINEQIRLTVESYPVVSCSIENNKKSVQEGDVSINILPRITNAPSYSWEAGPDSGDKTINKQSGYNPMPNPNPLTLNYTGLDFGRYRPWVSATRTGRTSTTTCGTITNFVSSTIREVTP